MSFRQISTTLSDTSNQKESSQSNQQEKSNEACLRNFILLGCHNETETAEDLKRGSELICSVLATDPTRLFTIMREGECFAYMGFVSYLEAVAEKMQQQQSIEKLAIVLSEPHLTTILEDIYLDLKNIHKLANLISQFARVKMLNEEPASMANHEFGLLIRNDEVTGYWQQEDKLHAKTVHLKNDSTLLQKLRMHLKLASVSHKDIAVVAFFKNNSEFPEISSLKTDKEIATSGRILLNLHHRERESKDFIESITTKYGIAPLPHYLATILTCVLNNNNLAKKLFGKNPEAIIQELRARHYPINLITQFTHLMVTLFPSINANVDTEQKMQSHSLKK